jgi:hypothetical protein
MKGSLHLHIEGQCSLASNFEINDSLISSVRTKSERLCMISAQLDAHVMAMVIKANATKRRRRRK